MKRILLLSAFLVLFLPFAVDATGGGLRKNSIKTCPNGVTYGMHADGHGGTHWHEAVTNGNNYYAKGDAIYNDPCPGNNVNEGTAGPTNGSNNSSSNESSNNTNSNNDSNTNNSSNNELPNNNENNISNNNEQPNSNNDNNTSNNVEQPNNNADTTTNDNEQSINIKEEIVEKSGDNSLKKVVIDEEEVEISDSMNYNTEKKNVSIMIEPSDSKAKVDFENKELFSGDNVIDITVTAENGDTKNYTLIINKKKLKGTATIKKFVLGAGEVKFENNKATITKMKYDSSLEYSYELSDENAKLILYLNEEETTELNSLKENDIIKLLVLDENNNENVYEIIVKNSSAALSLFVYGLAILIMIFPILVIILVIVFIKKKKRRRLYK